MHSCWRVCVVTTMPAVGGRVGVCVCKRLLVLLLAASSDVDIITLCS